MAMVKRAMVGWMAKDVVETMLAVRDFTEPRTTLKTQLVYADRGIESDWGRSQWPPVRVRITVEEV